jgi:sterol desaturase/sphingolipid hydroxylase (fatty acid hydroxylase superfamily)
MSWALLSPAIIVGSALVLVLLERRFPYDRGQSLFRDGFWTDLLPYTLVQSYVLAYAIGALISGLDRLTGASRHGLLSGWPLWAQVALFVVTHDFYIYWFHRWQHHSPVLWRLHEAHHSVADVDWVAGSRSHPLEILINQTIEFAPMVLLAAHPDVPLIKATISAVWGMWIHSNIDVRTGRLQWIVNGPEAHRWHHATDADAWDKNFGTKLAIWDRLFATTFLPVGRKPRGYGLTHPPFPASYWKQVVFAFRSAAHDRDTDAADAHAA